MSLAMVIKHFMVIHFDFQGLTSTAVKKGGLYSLDLSSVYKYKNTLVDVKVDTESNVSDTKLKCMHILFVYHG
jgi:hypothetical protein